MIIKIATPLLMLLGLLLYIAFDSPNGDAVRWPGVTLIAIGLLLIPVYHIFSFNNKQLGIQKPSSRLFKLSLVLFVIAALSFGAIFLYEGFKGFYWFYVSILSGVIGLIMLIASLYIKGKR